MKYLTTYLRIQFLLIAGIFFCWNLQAQRIDTLIANYANVFTPEKLHLHFDKTVYNPGETIWFKSYLFSGAMPSLLSKTIYFELLNEDGKIINRTTAPVIESSAASQFEIDKSYNQPYVYLRAYTKWMYNFDTTFLYHKAIPVIQQKNIAPKITTTQLKFLPEGGNLVAGISSVIAFKCTNSNGHPANIKGVITESDGKIISPFQSSHNGMGTFLFTPAAGKTYMAVWKDSNGKEYKTALPDCTPSGATLQITSGPSHILFSIKRTEDNQPSLNKLRLVATFDQQTIYFANVNMSVQFNTSGSIPTIDLPTGIVQVSLFDNNWVPLAERIVFINKNDYFADAYVNNLTTNLAKRGKNEIQIEIPDTLKTNLSIAVTDAGIERPLENEDNIVSRMLLTSELRGPIYDPYYYFSNSSDSTAQQLDLIMLTNGWRKYNWPEIISGNVPPAAYIPDGYLDLQGTIAGLDLKKLSAGEQLNMILKGADSSVQMVSVPIAKDGSFSYQNLLFFDKMQVFYQMNSKTKTHGDITLSLDNGLWKGNPFITTNSNFFTPFLIPENETANANRTLSTTIKNNSFKNTNVKTLDEVVVKAKQKSNIEKLNEQYARGLFSGADGFSFDFTNDLSATGAISLLNYLQGRVPGLSINNSTNPPSLSWRNAAPTLYLDEMQTDASIIQSIPMSDIAFVKVIRPPFFGAPGGGSGGAIAVYTKKGNAQTNTANTKGLNNTVVQGYTAMKSFYSPDYAVALPAHENPDFRSTLYWQPFLLLDKNNRRTNLKFYNNDFSKKLRIVVEGVNAEGKLIRTEKIIDK